MTADGTGETRRLHLASWDDRIFAWLIDVLVVGAAVSALGETTLAVSIVDGGASVLAPFAGLNGLGLWVYWTVLEGMSGQSAGKMVMDVGVTDERGDDIDYVTAAVESFGKAFLLPLDVIVGWAFMDDEYVRLFNRLSGTIVVDVPGDDRAPEGVEYVPPGE